VPRHGVPRHKNRSGIDHLVGNLSPLGVFIDYRGELRAGVAARPNSRHGSKRITDCKLVRFVYILVFSFAISPYMPARAEVRVGGGGCKRLGDGTGSRILGFTKRGHPDDRGCAVPLNVTLTKIPDLYCRSFPPHCPYTCRGVTTIEGVAPCACCVRFKESPRNGHGHHKPQGLRGYAVHI
jgi:hypothetical protein